ncbi:toll/interleukin-1 receptor domain-containing protein [Nocardia arthritidis]|uniref:TIR domain-containing protein n=1 Tax=Nocardia arthritidis TaxID=228602 RepID=A0A6G9YBP2_9NOCA|nr:toll/interleukin-1 receptor domain-containing protein [Nocardia arthritidis]QIS10497.1 TIR domain-containing protein [Nocardia arthritidis]
MTGAVRVFISYAKADRAHSDAVRNLWNFLRQNGIDARLDLPAAGRRQDWPVWMQREIEAADYVLVAASAAYRASSDRRAANGAGRGANYEAALLRELIYADREKWYGRILPVLLPGATADDIPVFLGPYSGSKYTVRDFTVAGAEKLLRVLTRQPEDPEPMMAKGVPKLPPRSSGLPGATGELAVAFLGASPFDIALGRVRGDREFQAIARVARRGGLRVAARTLSTAGDIGKLLEERPDIVHCCGAFRSADRAILLADPTAQPHVISIDGLVQRIGLAREYGRPLPRVIVFSIGASAEFATDFTDFAETVIAWRGAIDADCARSFGSVFYGALARDPHCDIRGAARLAARDTAAGNGCDTFADQMVLLGD